MSYVQRDANGKVVGVYYLQQDNAAEFLEDTDPELLAFLTPSPKAVIQAQIDALETKAIMPRVTREALLALAIQEAAAAGFTEPQLYAMNKGYQKTKDADTVIAALRDKMAAIQ